MGPCFASLAREMTEFPAFRGVNDGAAIAPRYLNNSDLMMIGTTLVSSITLPMST
jgi:hypothetical protein